MEQYTLEFYEALGHWQVHLNRRHQHEDRGWDTEMLYRGWHVPIDEQDPLVRAVLILHQVYTDLNQAIRGEMDILAERPAHH